MRNGPLLWQTFQAAKRWGARPSELLDLGDDPYVAYCVDEAVGYFGTYVEDKIRNVKGKNDKVKAAKADNLLRKYLGMKQQFRDIGELLPKK